MTQEQKEQLARDGVTIVTNTKRVTQEDLYRIILWALNARDEEFALLKAEIEDDNAVMKQLKAELNKAQNPWIKADDEHLPKCEANPDEFNSPHRKRSSKNVIVKCGESINRGYYSYARERWEWNEGEINVEYWMPIPPTPQK